MSAIESEFGRALDGAVKRKRNVSGKLRSTNIKAKAQRVASGSSEVMVKVTSYGKGATAVKKHLEYITRNGKVEMENDRGEVFKGMDEVKGFFKDWEQDFAGGKRQKERRDTMHMMLSMPEDTPPEAVRTAVRKFAQVNFAENHEYVFALHCKENDPDTKQPHCHLTVKMLGHNGKRLNPGRLDLANWREDFAQALREQGVDAEATRRSSRGVVQKAENTVVRHIERGDKTHAPRHSKVKALMELDAIKQIEQEHAGKKSQTPPVWEAKIKTEQKEIRAAWVAAAKALDRPVPKPLYKSAKDQTNERPDYAKLDNAKTRHHQRLVAVSQSNLAKARSKEPPRSVASMRDMPGLAVVHNAGANKVLLHSNARDRMGRGRDTGNALRRQGVGDIGTLGGSKRLGSIKTAFDSDKALAATIRGFVEAMPSLEPVATKTNEIKKALLARFSKVRELAPAPQPAPGAKGAQPLAEQKKTRTKPRQFQTRGKTWIGRLLAGSLQEGIVRRAALSSRLVMCHQDAFVVEFKGGRFGNILADHRLSNLREIVVPDFLRANLCFAGRLADQGNYIGIAALVVSSRRHLPRSDLRTRLVGAQVGKTRNCTAC